MPPPNQLTATFVLNKTRKDRLEAVRELNAWGQDVEDLSVLAECPYLEVLALACNKVRSLKQLSRCKKLKQLLLRKNQISDIAEVYHLSKLPDLQILSLSDNPVAAEEEYRSKVLAYLPRLQRLDDVPVTPDEVEDAQARFPDAPHGISQDGGTSVGRRAGGSEAGSASDWDAQQSRTPPGPSPALSPGGTPTGLAVAAPGSVPLQSPPRSRTPLPGGYPGDGQIAYFADGPTQQQPQLQQGTPQGYGHDTSPVRQPQPQQLQFVSYGGSPAPQQPGGVAYGEYGGGANGMPQQQQLPQQYISPQQQPPPPQGVYTPNGMQQYQGMPQYANPGWAPSPLQQQPPPQQQQQQPPAGPSETTSDNIFYAIVALLPELSPKHLLWVKGEVEARLLEVQQQQLNING